MANTGFTVAGTEVSNPFVPKSYLIDRYPELANTFKTAGLWLAGRNDFGQLGNNTTLSPTISIIQTVAGGTNWKQVSLGPYDSHAIKTDGTLWGWGYNYYGQLGDNTITSKSSPVQTVSGGTNWKQLTDAYYTVFAIKTDGTLWGWGYNAFGQLGTNNRTNYSSPVQTVSGGTNWKLVSTSNQNTTAIKTDGTLWTWGYGVYGQLGDNTIVTKSSPVQTVSGGTNWKTVSQGAYFTAAIKTDGTLWTWGYNTTYGSLGTNNTTDRSSPVQTVAGGTNWKQVSTGDYYTMAIKTDGTLWGWGRNFYGNLGNNQNNTNVSSPTQTVAGGTNWYSVSAGLGGTVNAIKTDGTLWGWGYNASGQAFINDQTDRSSPVQTAFGGTNWKQISSGTNHSAAIRDDSADFGIGTL